MLLIAGNRQVLLDRHHWPLCDHQQQLDSIMKDPQDARDYTMTSRDINNLRGQYARLNWKLHEEDAESLRQLVRCNTI